MVGSQQRTAIRFPMWALFRPEVADRVGLFQSIEIENHFIDDSTRWDVMLFTSEERAVAHRESWGRSFPGAFDDVAVLPIECRTSFDEWRPLLATRRVTDFLIDYADFGSQDERLTADELFGQRGERFTVDEFYERLGS